MGRTWISWTGVGVSVGTFVGPGAVVVGSVLCKVAVEEQMFERRQRAWRWSVVILCVTMFEGDLMDFINSFSAMGKFYVGVAMGVRTWVGKNWAVAQISFPPVVGTKKW